VSDDAQVACVNSHFAVCRPEQLIAGLTPGAALLHEAPTLTIEKLGEASRARS
jgi:hypothetical protein